MTNEEAISIIENRIKLPDDDTYGGMCEKEYQQEALNLAISALRAQEKEPCEICSGNSLPCDNDCDGFCDICDIPEVWKTIHKTGQYNYCPMCGRPLKGE